MPATRKPAARFEQATICYFGGVCHAEVEIDGYRELCTIIHEEVAHRLAQGQTLPTPAVKATRALEFVAAKIIIGMSIAQRKTPIELYRLAVAALDQAMGPVESLRFLRLLNPGSGDYTAERQTGMDHTPSTVDELCDQIRSARTTIQTP